MVRILIGEEAIMKNSLKFENDRHRHNVDSRSAIFRWTSCLFSYAALRACSESSAPKARLRA